MPETPADATSPRLIGLPYSPWSEKARWALDAAGVDYRFQHYQPLIGEPGLRRLTGRWSGPVSVPVLVAGGRGIADSGAIARHADSVSASPGRLFPPGREPEIERVIALGERALGAGRALALHRQLGDSEALRELVPRGLRNALGPLATPIAAFGVRRTLRKYGAAPLDAAGQALDGALVELRALLAAPGGGLRPTVLEAFSFADIAAAQALGFVAPVDSPHVRVGPRSRQSFSEPARAARFADLVEWRDALYAKHRGPVRAR